MPPDSADPEQKIIDAIYRGACDPAELATAIELMAQYFDVSGASLGELDPAAPEAQFVIGARTFDQAFLADYPPYAQMDPAPRAFSALALGTVSTTDRMFSQDFLRTDVFLNEFLRPRGIDATLGGPVISAGGRFAILGLLQGTNRKRFDSDDIARLERLTPHLTRALQIRRLFLRSELRGQVLEAVMNRNQTGMIGLSGKGAAIFVNDAARLIAAARDGVSLDRRGRLVAADRRAAKLLTELQADVARGGSGGLVRIPRPSGSPPYLILVSPLPSTAELVPIGERGILIAIHDPNRRIASAVQRIAQLLHVPLGAAKVVEAILDGIELKDYADRAGISMNTVKFHLKTAFDRTGARSQTDLVRRALLALNDLGPYFSGG